MIFSYSYGYFPLLFLVNFVGIKSVFYEPNVYFSGGRCEKGEECNNVLEELENIDDELDESGIIFVSTEDVLIAKKHGIRNYPALAFFRNKEPLIYRGELFYCVLHSSIQFCIARIVFHSVVINL